MNVLSWMIPFWPSVGSLNWMSYAITFAPAAFRFLIACAWTVRVKGQRFPSSLKVVSSIFTTMMFFGGFSRPRIAKRRSMLLSSAPPKTSQPEPGAIRWLP
jgi:hypothetical protein